MSNNEALGDPVQADGPLTEEPVRRGRGPTRPVVRAADWAEDVLGSEWALAVNADVQLGPKAGGHKAEADRREADLPRFIENERRAIRCLREHGALIDRYLALPPEAQKLAKRMLRLGIEDRRAEKEPAS